MSHNENEEEDDDDENSHHNRKGINERNYYGTSYQHKNQDGTSVRNQQNSHSEKSLWNWKEDSGMLPTQFKNLSDEITIKLDSFS